MKKILIISVVLLACIFCVPARNGQEIIPLSSGLYDAMDALFIMEGKALPSTVRPWSISEAERYLSLISEDTSPALYGYVAGILGREPLFSFDEYAGLTLGASSNVNGYFHTNTDFDWQFNPVENYFFRMDNDNDKSILRLELKGYFGSLFHIYFSFNIKNADWTDDKPFDSRNFNFDLCPFTPDGFTFDEELSVPDRAFLSAGGDFWNIQLGRDRFMIGAGKTGSLILSDNFPYHNMLRLNLFGSRLKFSFAVSSFWHPQVYEVGDEKTKGIYLLITNRIEGRLFSDRLTIAFNNTTLYKDDNGLIDLRYMNPLDYYHNFFISHKQNASAAFELIYAMAKGWNAYAQVIIDDISSPGENDDGKDTAPDQIGYMLGIRYTTVLGKGVLGVNLEAVYTYPFLYLRSTNRDDQPDDDPGLGYIGIFRSVGGGIPLRKYFIGYTYGGDAAVLDLSGSYVIPDDLKAEAEVFFMVHGEKNIESKYRHGELSPRLSGELSCYSFLKLYFRREVTSWLGLYGQYNLAYGKNQIDNQFVIGAGLSL